MEQIEFLLSRCDAMQTECKDYTIEQASIAARYLALSLQTCIDPYIYISVNGFIGVKADTKPTAQQQRLLKKVIDTCILFIHALFPRADSNFCETMAIRTIQDALTKPVTI